jgi:ATP-dependent RNA helicase DDX51/DBP6
LAYLVPLIQDLKLKLETRLRALVVVPTRELVKQARQEAESIATGTGVKIGTAVGTKALAEEQRLLVQKRFRDEEEDLERLLDDINFSDPSYDSGERPQVSISGPQFLPSTSEVDILICTPGRLVEHIRSTNHFYLQHVEYLVIDEADQLLDDKFQEWVELVLSEIKRTSRMNARSYILEQNVVLRDDRIVKKIILSATMTRDLAKLATLQLHFPMLVGLQVQQSNDEDTARSEHLEPIELPTKLVEYASPVGEGGDKPLYLMHLINSLMDGSLNEHIASSAVKILVFTNKTEDAERLRYVIAFLDPGLGSRLGVLTKMTSKSEKKVLSAFLSGKISVLIASDRVSRGLDVPELSAVISYDMPKDTTLYIHRIGRTARADKAGIAWSLYTKAQGHWFWKTIAHADQIRRLSPITKRKLEVTFAEDDDIKVRYESALEDLKHAVFGRS